MKKLKKKIEKPVKRPILFDRLPSNYGEWLELCIKFTEKAIHNPPYEEDKFLILQAERLKLELKQWKKENV